MSSKSLVWHKPWTPWIFLLPTVIGLFVFRLMPIVAAFILSFSDWNLLASPRFHGFANYIEALKDPDTWLVIRNTFKFSVFYVIGGMLFGLILACLINVKIKGINFFRAAIYMPVITSSVAVGIVWRWLLGPNYGLLSVILKSVGIMTMPNWLGDKKLVLFTVAFVQVWKMSGYYMILFLAGLQNISHEMMEAATIDGASRPQRFFRITLPLLSPTTFFILTIAIIDSFKNFELILAMTRGGPMNASNTLVYDVYLNAFVYYRVGFAESIAFILLIIVAFFTVSNFYIRKRWAQPWD